MTDPSTEGAVNDGSARWERAADLFAAWRSGKSRAMDDLVRLMTPVLWHVVRAYGLERTLAEDVVQSTWLALVRGHEKITETQAVSGWLTITARRETWRVSKIGRRADATNDEVLEPLPPPQQSTEAEVTASDLAMPIGSIGPTRKRCLAKLRTALVHTGFSEEGDRDD